MLSWLKKLLSGAKPTPSSVSRDERWWASEFPDWADSIGTHERFEVFMDGVARYFAARGVVVQISREGTVVPQAKGEQQTFGLSNLLQNCAQRETEEFSGLVAAHFDVMDRIRTRASRVAGQLESWEFAMPLLKVRLWDQDASMPKEVIVLRRDIPGLWTVLVFDLPEAIQSVPRDVAAKWGRSEEEMFDVAIQNTRREVASRVAPLDPEDPQGPSMVEADSFFTSSLALQIGQFPELLGGHGAFVSVPTRSHFLALPFDSMEALQRVGSFLQFTRICFDQGPGSVSHRLWWYHDGLWHEIPYEFDGRQASINCPPALESYLSRIAEEEL